MSGIPGFRCPCGAPVPGDLPPPGARPVRCSACSTPLVRPGRTAAAALERGIAGAVVAGSLCAVAWMFLVRLLGNDAPMAVAAAGPLIGGSTWLAARVRGTGVQAAAGIGVLVFLVLGEFLIYRQALMPWLESLHAAEGAGDAYMRARDEMADMDVERFVHLATSMHLFVALAVAFIGALWITHAPPAVAAFVDHGAPPAEDEPPPADPPAPLEEAAS